MADTGRDRDLVLAPGEFAYVLDETKGLINVAVGPYKTSMAGTDQPMVFDKEQLKFVRVDLARAIQRDLVAPEGFYLVLYNPAKPNAEAHPVGGKSSISADLTVGHRVNIPGPAHFALWPGQMADVVRGHHLRSNQYLLAQVYNDVEASTNWKQAIVKPQGEAPVGDLAPAKFAPGQTIVIKGTDVAFFIPPTGIKVVPQDGNQFVREAVTLERLEYCILLDEAGEKRFVQGPDVVFPSPTETFVLGKDGARKFKAIELNATTGIYVKVIADYEEDDPRNATLTHGQTPYPKVRRKTGDELFITGAEQAIYFQREEHSVIRYDDQTKHYAVAIPSGEGRYVLNRATGVISLVKGPKMLLCDPRTEVIVRRVLSQKAVGLMYPGNAGALAVNRELEASTKEADPSQYAAGRVLRSSGAAYMMALNVADEQALSSRQLAGDTFTRGSSFTPPRTITLDTKYEGAVAVDVWPGYAVNVVDKTGTRRVVEGPKTVLLNYDESLAPLSLSTGTPKNADKLLETVYLRVSNNSISDVITAETADFVPVQLKVAYRVNFTGAQSNWFAVENYIGLLTDHTRSLIRNAVKRTGIEAFYAGAIDLVRDIVLGVAPDAGKRPGRTFAENGMSIYDVEVLEVKINNPAVASKLQQVQADSISAAVDIAQLERTLETTKRSETVREALAKVTAETAGLVAEHTKTTLKAELSVAMARTANDATVAAQVLKDREAREAAEDKLSAADIARRQSVFDFEHGTRTKAVELEITKLLKESEEITKRAAAISPALANALLTFSDQELVKTISQALAPMAAMSGVSAAEILSKLFQGTSFAGVMDALGQRSRVPLSDRK